VAIVDWFAGGGIAFAMGLSLAIGRSRSFSADMSPTWFFCAYSAGWQPPLVIAASIAAIGLVAAIAYRGLDTKHRVATSSPRPLHPRLTPRDLLLFGRAYWYLLVLCVLWYAAMFATPAFGWLRDRTGRYAPLLVFGALLLPLAIVIMAYTSWSLWIATALIGVSYSLVPAVMWPLLSKLVVPERFGTAIGLMWVVQNAGIAGANLVAGWLNDRAGASALNPEGYEPMMRFFGISSSLGFVFALMLWLTAGRRRHEVGMSRS